MTLPGAYSCHREECKTSKENVWCAQNMEEGENLFTGVVILRHGCV
jgi:hypothetical protein